MTSKQTPLGGLYSYVYDNENRLTSIGFAPAGKIAKTIATYNYDGDGGRTRKIVYRYSDTSYNNAETYGILVTQLGAPTFGVSVTSTSTSTIYVGNLYEIEGARKTNNIYLGSTRVAAVTGAEVDFYHNDHLGSTNVISDAAGLVRSLTEYEPFGKISRFEKYGTKINNTWAFFNSKLFDEESGLYYYGARYYDPKLGRFITPDTIVQAPSNPQTLNRYTYCNNNPVNLIDPTGHKWSWNKFWKAAVAAVVSAIVFVATGGTATPVIAGFWAGMAGGAVSGALSGGGIKAILTGAAFGAITGAALGGIGAWGTANVSKDFGWGMLAAAGGYSAATGNLDSFAGGVIGGIAGTMAYNAINNSIKTANNEKLWQEYQKKIDELYLQNKEQRNASVLKVSRPLSWKDGSPGSTTGPRHNLLIMPDGSIKEMGPDDIGRIAINPWKTAATSDISLDKGGVYTRSSYADVNIDGVAQAISLYDKTIVQTGTKYNAFNHNSNYAVDSWIRGGGGDVPKGFRDPGFPSIN